MSEAPTPARSAVITGASTGIGRATALRLDAAGWRVFAGVRKDADAAALAQAASARLEPLRIDVTDASSLEAAAADVDKRLAGRGLDALVNNAGISVSGPLEFLPLDGLRHQLEVNVVGLVASTQAFLPALRRARGRIVNVGSMAGYLSSACQGPYAASKHAVEALSDALRRELAPWKIEVVCIEPGSIETEIWGKGIAEAKATAGGIPEQGRHLYGPAIETLLKAAEEMARRAIPADEAAKVIESALRAPRPATRYRVGNDAKLMHLLTALLPDRGLDAFLQRFTGLRKAYRGRVPE